MPKRLTLLVAVGAIIIGFTLAPLMFGRRVSSAETMLTIDHPFALTADIPVEPLARQRQGGRPISMKVSLLLADYDRKPGEEDTLLRILAGSGQPKPSDTERRTLGLMSLGGHHRSQAATQRFQILLELSDDALGSIESSGGARPTLPLLILLEPMSGKDALKVVEATAEVIAP